MEKNDAKILFEIKSGLKSESAVFTLDHALFLKSISEELKCKYLFLMN